MNWTMKHILPIALVFSMSAAAHSQSVDVNSAAAPSIPYGTLQVIGKDDSPAVIAEKAVKVLPRPNQTAWMRMERTFFLHYGPNTFRGVEWGNGRENPSVFNPTAFDAEQWMRAIKDANGKMLVLVCKHYDGLCLWQTRYTNHSIAGSPWRGGKGDEVREVAEAARKYDIKLGVYLSPADLYQLRTNPTNLRPYYGNRSPKLRSTIPTDPASFQTDPSQGRTPPAGFKSYNYEVDDYNRYFLNQLYELLTDYGPIHEVWFDGANPDRSVPETYDYAAWYDLIRKLRPEAVIAVKGPDVRWVGNENGVGRTTEWSVIPLPKSPETNSWADQGGRDLGSRAKLVPGSYLWWYPAEVNQPILYGWFWAPGKGVRSAADLVNTYYQSVGRNGVWLLNLSPDTRGLIPDNQLASLNLSSRVIRDTFAKNLAAGGTLTADSSNTANNPSLALDGNLDTWWEAAQGKTTAELTLKLPSPATFDVISLQEALDRRGQRIESFSFDVWDGSQWNAADTLEERTTIGFKRLSRLRSPATTDRVRIRIDQARLEPTLAEIGLFKQQTQAVPKTFIDYFLPTPPQGALSRDAWGAPNVLPRDPKNGLEDTTIKKYCYWDGQIIKARDGKYHMFASRWAESRGHNGWFGSVAVHAVSDSLMGPYIDKGLCWPNDAGGRGHNVGALTLPDGRYAVYVSETRPTEIYVSQSLDGPWEHLGRITVEGNTRWHGSNVSLMVRPDGTFEFTQRDGSIYTSDKGILGPYKRQSSSVYPKGIPNLEDPCIWYSGGLYHIVVNSWSTRKAYHLTSPDGIHNWTTRGVAYDPRESMVRYPDGTVNHWNKLERPAVYLENGHVVAMTFAAIDVEKEQDRGGDGHGSKVIVIPFDGAALDRDMKASASSQK